MCSGEGILFPTCGNGLDILNEVISLCLFLSVANEHIVDVVFY